MYEVLDAAINLHLNDQDAIRGVERLRTTVKRNMAAISREKAIVSIEGNLRELKKDLKEAKALVAANEKEMKALAKGRDEMTAAQKGQATKRTKALADQNRLLKEQIPILARQVKAVGDNLDTYKQINKEVSTHTKALKEQERVQDGVTSAINKSNDARQKEGQLQARALADDRKRSEAIQNQAQQMGKLHSQALKMDQERTKSAREYEQSQGALQARAQREMENDFKKRDTAERKAAAQHAAALREDISRQATVNRLQQEYTRARERARRIDERRRTVGGRLAEASSPAVKQEVEINQARAIGEMEILRHELKAMGEKPIDIDTKLNEKGNLLAKLGGLGEFGARIGPFAGSLAQFGKALLVLGPILTGVVGYIGALTGAIGAGLTGALGLAGAALAGFGLSLGGVGLLTASLLRDFKNLNTLQDAYHKQVLKTGAGSDKAKTKLAEFNHALGAVTPTTRAAFMTLGKLQDRWRGLRKDVRPDFMAAMGEAIKTANKDFDIFGSRTQQAFKAVSKGFQQWMKGLRSRDARTTIDSLMKNANAAIPPLMHALGQLGGAIGRVAASFSRYLKPELERFDAWTTGINKAASNTDKLDNGVSGMMASFDSLVDVLSGAGRVLKEFMLTAMGPGGTALNSLADGLNSIADTISSDRAGDNKLGKFLSDSVTTTDKLYNAVQPLLKLFLEFTTIMRPFTDALLSIIGPLAKLTEGFLSLNGVHTGLQILAGAWLFQRGTVGLFTNLASSARVFATAMKAISGLKIVGMIPGLADKLRGGAVGAENLANRTTRGAERIRGGVDDAALGRTTANRNPRNAFRYPGMEDAGKVNPNTVSKNVTGSFREGFRRAAPVLTGVAGAMLGGAMIGGVSSAIRGKNWKDVWRDAASTATLGILPGADEQKARNTEKLLDGLKSKLNDLALTGPKLKITQNNLTDMLKTGENFKTRVIDQFDIRKFNIAAGFDDLKKHMDQIGPAGEAAARAFLQNLATIKQGISSLNASGGDDIRTLRGVFDKNMRAISKSMGTHTAAGVASASQNFKAFVGAVKRAMDRGVVNTQEGLKAISSAFEAELRAIGYKGSVSQVMEIRRYQDKHGRGTGTGQANLAVGGFIGNPAAKGRDTVPLMVGEGEAVVNRHQQVVIDAGLRSIGVNGLRDLFNTVNTPHYAARGRLPRPVVRGGGLLDPTVQLRTDKFRNVAQNKLDRKLAEQAANSSGAVGSTTGLAPLVKRALAWARTHGWHGSVTSGFRSRAEQAVLYARYLAGGNIAAKPGSSNHERGLAIDVSDIPGFRRAMSSAPANARLRWYGPGDAVHFSVDGRARGGFAKAARGRKPKGKTGGTFSSTSYGPPWGGIQGTGTTATGVNLAKAPHRYGIAVDPSVIPLGSNVHVWPNPFGYKGTFRAFDTGGAIKGRRIDFYDWRGRRAQNGWGRRSVEVSYGRLSTSQGQPQPIKGTQGPAPSFGATMDLPNVLALDESNMDRAQNRTPFNYADDIWNAGAQIGHLGQQDAGSRKRIGVIDKRLKGKLTPDNRSSLLSERAGLVSGLTSNRQKVRELRKTASDNLFELKRGIGNDMKSINYSKALADRTVTLDDDLDVAKKEEAYWEARYDWLQTHGGDQADVVDAMNNWNTATNTVKGIQDQQKANMEAVKRQTLDAANGAASLTPDLGDDLAAAQSTEDWVQGMYDLAVTLNDTEGIAKWAPELKTARDTVNGIKENIALLGPQMAQSSAALTTDLNDDVDAAKGFVDYYQGLYNTSTGAEKVAAGQSLASARSDLASASRNAELLPLERNQALAALTDTLDDDKAATIALRDYWAGQLENAKASGDIPGQIEAAGNLKGLNDQINEAQQTVAAQMVLLSEARRDLYKAFSNNFISQVPAGTLAPQPSSVYNGGTTVNVTNNFQEPPADPHTWSAGVSWELQAAV